MDEPEALENQRSVQSRAEEELKKLGIDASEIPSRKWKTTEGGPDHLILSIQDLIMRPQSSLTPRLLEIRNILVENEPLIWHIICNIREDNRMKILGMLYGNLSNKKDRIELASDYEEVLGAQGVPQAQALESLKKAWLSISLKKRKQPPGRALWYLDHAILAKEIESIDFESLGD